MDIPFSCSRCGKPGVLDVPDGQDPPKTGYCGKCLSRDDVRQQLGVRQALERGIAVLYQEPDGTYSVRHAGTGAQLLTRHPHL